MKKSGDRDGDRYGDQPPALAYAEWQCRVLDLLGVLGKSARWMVVLIRDFNAHVGSDNERDGLGGASSLI